MAAVTTTNSTKVLKQIPSKISQVLRHLNQQPKLQLQNVANFKIRWSAKNNSFGARYFVKDALPRIRWANPSLQIEVDKVWKTEAPVKQNIQLTFASGKTRTIEMDSKWSTAIIRELMEVAGGDPWREYKKLRTAEGLPLLPGEEDEHKHRRALTLKQSEKVTKPTRRPKPTDS